MAIKKTEILSEKIEYWNCERAGCTTKHSTEETALRCRHAYLTHEQHMDKRVNCQLRNLRMFRAFLLGDTLKSIKDEFGVNPRDILRHLLNRYFREIKRGRIKGDIYSENWPSDDRGKVAMWASSLPHEGRDICLGWIKEKEDSFL